MSHIGDPLGSITNPQKTLPKPKTIAANQIYTRAFSPPPSRPLSLVSALDCTPSDCITGQGIGGGGLCEPHLKNLEIPQCSLPPSVPAEEHSLASLFLEPSRVLISLGTRTLGYGNIQFCFPQGCGGRRPKTRSDSAGSVGKEIRTHPVTAKCSCAPSPGKRRLLGSQAPNLEEGAVGPERPKGSLQTPGLANGCL